MRRYLLSLLLSACSLACHGAAPRFTVVTVDPALEKLQLFLNDDAGEPFKGFGALSAWLENRGERLSFAVNAGMYHANFSPVGLFVQDGRELAPLNLDEGYGNFFLKPNGVFLVSASGPRVVESSLYPALILSQGVRLATQSGPLLLQDGVMHPAFRQASASRHLRNGVGVAGGKAVFVISEDPVTFYELAAFFRDELHCRDALYLDGSISSMYSARLQRNDARSVLGPILGVLK